MSPGRLTVLSLVAFLGAARAANPSPAAAKYNVLFLVSDDMRWDIGCDAPGGAITPHLDKLAQQGERFTSAFTQFSVCNPSRTAFLTSHYPTATGVLFNNGTSFRVLHPELIPLPEYFQRHGYITANAGKVFHPVDPDPASWTAYSADEMPPEQKIPPLNFDSHGQPTTAPARTGAFDGRPGEGLVAGPDGARYSVYPKDGAGNVDNWLVDRGIEYLQKYKDRPFFIAVGLRAPHATPGAPQRFYDLYPLDQIKLPPDFALQPTAPPGCPPFMLPPTNDQFYIPGVMTEDIARRIIRATRAATSYCDWNMGRLLDALDRLGLAQNTIVVFLSDHGYHLGEKGRFGKTTAFDIAMRVPLIIRVPDSAGNGKFCTRTVQLIDLYPTLAQLCGLPIPDGLSGRSLVPLLQDPAIPWDHPALSLSITAGHMGYTARTEKFRYVEYEHGRAGQILFDLVKDPLQTRNVAADPAYAATVQQMKKALEDGWGPMPDKIPPRLGPKPQPTPGLKSGD